MAWILPPREQSQSWEDGETVLGLLMEYFVLAISFSAFHRCSIVVDTIRLFIYQTSGKQQKHEHENLL